MILPRSTGCPLKKRFEASEGKGSLLASLNHSLLRMPPLAWRSALEPAELSFRVPHFFHQTPRGHSRDDDPL